MKNWEQMKEISYVGIKLTKAKSITEGLTRCKIDKLSRKNPVYQHLRLHKFYKNHSHCKICTSPPKVTATINSSPQQQIYSQSVPLRQQRQSASKKIRSQKLKSNLIFPAEYRSYLGRILNTPKEKARQDTEKFNETVAQFDQSLRKTRSQFHFVSTKKNKIEDYFFTAIDDIQLEINEDKGLSLRQLRTDSKAMKEEMQELMKRRNEREKKVKQLIKPVRFPLTGRQIKTIVDDKQKTIRNSQAKLSKMVTSLFEYKSCKNYSKRMKTISSIIQRN